MARIGIFGAGYVGLVTGACLADLGHDVTVRDVLPERIAELQAGRVPIHEPGLEELIARNRERLRFTLDVREAIEGAEFLFVCVGTPPLPSGDADLAAVWTVVDELPGVETPLTVVMKSTVPVGTGEKVRTALDGRGLQHVGYVSNPEFTAEGSAVQDFMHPDRIVIGSFRAADGDAVEQLHEGIEGEVVRTDVASAEMIKMASNAFLSTRISFINEIANVCELVGADVTDVARGVGLDHRLGPHFLRAGIGFGGSCLDGRETVLARLGGRVWLTRLDRLFAELVGPQDVYAIRPEGLEVLAWRPDGEAPEFLPVAAATRRRYQGPMFEVKTKMGRRVRCTADHPFVVADAQGGNIRLKLAEVLTAEDWLPLAQGAAVEETPRPLDVLAGMRAVGLASEDVIVRPDRRELAAVGAPAIRETLGELGRPRTRAGDILRSGALRLREAEAIGLPLHHAGYGTVKNGTYAPAAIEPDEEFWRIVGLYIAEGHAVAGQHRLQWCFHPHAEYDLVEEVLRFWQFRGVKAVWQQAATSAKVYVASRLVVGWWLGVLGLGANCYEQRLPDDIWTAPLKHKRALLGGLWRGDGSWSYVNRGPSVTLEYGTVSRELADGLLRLLGDLGFVGSLRVGRTKKSTCDTYWLRISGADQVERLLELVPERDRASIQASLAMQQKRIAPTGYRRHEGPTAWARVVEVGPTPSSGWVYSLEIPQAHTFVTTGGLVTSNCFPKDVSALKQLAGNRGYHFQLLAAVIEVNELQKRRIVQKLQKYLGPLNGTKIALLGLAFKPNTDDMREAPSIVLASRLIAEGAEVRGWDPVADATALMPSLRQCGTPLEAVAGADAAVIVTEWPQLADEDWPALAAAMHRPLLLDGRNFLDPKEALRAGFVYEGIGRSVAWDGALERDPSL
ncbi:MAG: nucleotide sugar dehydrogenase [Gaiellaceae bacterium]